MVNSALAAAPDQRTAPHAAANPAVLTLSNVEVLYAEVILALKGVSMQVPEGGCVALLGANGAGKSTTLKAISGVIDSEDGRVSGGRSPSTADRFRGTTRRPWCAVVWFM